MVGAQKVSHHAFIHKPETVSILSTERHSAVCFIEITRKAEKGRASDFERAENEENVKDT
jgi:hypothetical protein